MKTFVPICVALGTLSIAHLVRAEEPENDGKPASQQSRPLGLAADASGKSAAPDNAWRFKFHKGHWWYWLPSNHWAVYENRRWLVPPDEHLAAAGDSSTPGDEAAKSADATRAVESQSFQDDYPAVPQDPESARKTAAYHLAVGNTYNRHADQHAQILDKYAALGETVPAGIVREHAAAIRHDVEQAHKAYSSLAKADKDNPGVAEAVAELQQRLGKLTESLKRLEDREQRQDALQAQMVRTQAAEISAILNDSYSAARKADQKFYDMQSESYYSSGEGHFVD